MEGGTGEPGLEGLEGPMASSAAGRALLTSLALQSDKRQEVTVMRRWACRWLIAFLRDTGISVGSEGTCLKTLFVFSSHDRGNRSALMQSYLKKDRYMKNE